ncbi:MAG: glutamine--tRNA ligase, partial [Elusimicrobia bacterium]|nr:glutamine--tRNA ligase [Elusimicrobiota bacterium]
MDKKNIKPSNFIRDIIIEDNKTGVYSGRVATRFPPEPNGYLHIGHAKSVFLNYGLAQEFKGTFNLRMDDTNPSREEEEFVQAIIRDVAWLGVDWGDRLTYASDYFEEMYEYAETLILSGHAYVDDLSPEEIRDYRGTLTSPGKESPYRDRTPEESLELFRGMRAGDFPDASRVLRAKIAMSSPNLNMRDPVMYRIQRTTHALTKDDWCIYPMYDFAHCLEDSLENITHSICTLEFENNRPLYDWFLEKLDIYRPKQIEFARLDLSYTVMSKRRLAPIVSSGKVKGWDDPRLPTISGLRRRGYTPSSIKDFCSRIGVAKANSLVDMALLEHCIREELNKTAPRRMAVIDPIKLIIENYPEDKVETFKAENNPEDENAGYRDISFSREI